MEITFSMVLVLGCIHQALKLKEKKQAPKKPLYFYAYITFAILIVLYNSGLLMNN